MTGFNSSSWGHYLVHQRNVWHDHDARHCSCGCDDPEVVAEGTMSALDEGEVAVDYECPSCGNRWEVFYYAPQVVEGKTVRIPFKRYQKVG